MNSRKFLFGCVAPALCALALASCGGSDSPLVVSQGTVIHNVSIINTRDGSLASGQSIVIDGGRIEQITSRGVTATGSAVSIDATGKYVVPGYLDMHAHVVADADAAQPHWPLLIANGVTGVREMSGSGAVITRARQLNADRAAGRVDAPEIVQVHGGGVAGLPPTSAEAGVQTVAANKALGADFLKITAGSPPFVLAALAEAKAQGMGVAGHLVTPVSALDSSNAGWQTIEHLGAGWGLIMDCTTNEAALRQAALLNAYRVPVPPPPTFLTNPRLYDGATNAVFYQGIIDSYSADKCQTLSQAFVANGTWQTPTLIRLRVQAFATDAAYRNDPKLQYVDKTRRALWEQLAQQFETTMPAAAATTLKDFYPLQLAVTRLMKQAGVKMMAGSDFATIGTWTIPGFSLHQEFEQLAAAGFSPLEVLQMTTLHPAEFLKREATMGTVEVGKNADLVLLDANPVADVVNLSRIAAVFLRGKHFSKAALDQMKADLAAAYASQPLQPLSTLIDPHHVH